jgi:hypothetical protein
MRSAGLLEQGEFPPAGLELHVLFGEEGSLRVSEVWATEDQQRAFNDETLMPVLNPGWRPTERRTRDYSGARVVPVLEAAAKRAGAGVVGRDGFVHGRGRASALHG